MSTTFFTGTDIFGHGSEFVNTKAVVHAGRCVREMVGEDCRERRLRGCVGKAAETSDENASERRSRKTINDGQGTKQSAGL